MKRFTRVVTLGAVAAGMFLASCTASEPSEPSESESPTPKTTVRVATSAEDQSLIIANLYVGALNESGQPAEVVQVVDGQAAITDVAKNSLQVLGAGASDLTTYLDKQANGADASPQASADLGATMNNLRSLATDAGMIALNPADATAQETFAVTKAYAEENELTNLSELGVFSQTHDVVVGGPKSCEKNPMCLPGLKQTYRLKVAKFESISGDEGAIDSALQEGRIDVGVVSSAAGFLDEDTLEVLDDDQGLVWVQNIVPLINDSVTSQGAKDALNRVSARLSTKSLQELNYSVVEAKEDPAVVADAWLAVNGFG